MPVTVMRSPETTVRQTLPTGSALGRGDHESSGLMLSRYGKADVLLVGWFFLCVLEFFSSKSADHFLGQCVNLDIIWILL